jgi:hypothetical protein
MTGCYGRGSTGQVPEDLASWLSSAGPWDLDPTGVCFSIHQWDYEFLLNPSNRQAAEVETVALETEK